MKDDEQTWLLSNDTGVSSKTIFSVMKRDKRALGDWFPSIPYDPSDFGRCYRLLEIFSEWKERLNEMASAYPEWKKFVEEWSNMEKLYERDYLSGESAELYALMKSCRSVQ